MKPLEALGRRACEFAESTRENLAFLGETTACALGMILHPGRFRLRDAALAFERASFDALPVTTGIGFLLGLILAFQSAAALRMFGVEVYVSDLLAIGLFRELGPLVTAIVLAGRTGSAFATMGLPPVRFLVMPRVVAAVAAMPVLTIFAELAGLIGGAIVLSMMDVPTTVFWRHVADVSTVFTISFGIVKGAFFGALVGLVGCAAGMRTTTAADGVGRAATSAVVGGIVSIAVADGLLAYLCYLWNI